MNILDIAGKLFLFKQKRQDVSFLYELYFEHVSIEMSNEPSFTRDRFTLAAAFACVFDELQLVSGFSGFASNIDHVAKKVQYTLPIHHWLIWQDYTYVIDILPVDGVFGVSVPQAVVQKDGLYRFFPATTLYPVSWSKAKISEFDKDVSVVVSILEELKEKIPHLSSYQE